MKPATRLQGPRECNATTISSSHKTLSHTFSHTGTLLEPEQETSYKARKAHAGAILQGALGPGFCVPGLTDTGQGKKGARDSSSGSTAPANNSSPGGARLVNREDVGVHVHTFSHIK